MKELKDCEIIKDLFPSYIDGLTNESTNQFIEEHLNNCKDCREMLEDMKKELNINTTKKDSQEVKYIKKFNKKMRLLKTILLVILLIFLLSYARKMIIIVSLNNKMTDYLSSTNFYVKTLNYDGSSVITIENYKKDDKYIRQLKVLSEISKMITTDYYNGQTVNTYTEVEVKQDEGEYLVRKTAQLNDTDNMIAPYIQNDISINHPITFLGKPLFSTITSEECNGKECYRIVSHLLDGSDGAIYYIDKETGLTIRASGVSNFTTDNGIRHDMLTDFQYKFDVVTDEDFIEPDISEYEIEK